MAPQIRSVQSQEILNVSQGFSSDPILKNTPPHSAPSPNELDGEAVSEDRIEESLTDDYLNANKFPEALPGHEAECLFEAVPVASRRDGFPEIFRAVEPAEGNNSILPAISSRDSKLLTENRARDAGDSLGDTHQDQAPGTSAETTHAAATHRGIYHIPDDTQTLASHLHSGATGGVDEAEVVPPGQTEPAGEEDLYGTTPLRKSQPSISKLHERQNEAFLSPICASRPHTAANVPEIEPLHFQQAPQQPDFRHLDTNTRAATAEQIVAESTVAHHTSMASGSKGATASTGKLHSAGSALQALQARKQQIVGRSGEASAKLFENAASQMEHTAKSVATGGQKADPLAKGLSKAPKAKHAKKSDSTSFRPATDNPKTRTIPRELLHSETGNRKRKNEHAAVDGEGNTAVASGHATKRAKGTACNRNDLPAKSRQSVASASVTGQPDHIFDLPESPARAERDGASKKRAGKPVAETTERVIKGGLPASNRDSTTVKAGPRKAAIVTNGGEGRQLRPRKPLQQLPIQPDESGENDVDHNPNLNQDRSLHATSLATHSVQLQANNKQISWRAERPDDREIAAEPEDKHELTPAIVSFEPAVALPPNSNPSGSQFNAIVLSDHSELSSSIDQDSQPREILPEKPAADLKTAAAIISSPPRAFSRTGSQSLRGTGRSRKTQIIKFDKNGPLNQGSVPKSRDVSVSVPTLTVPVNWDSPTGKVTDVARKKASSVTTSIRSGRSNLAAPPSNVALDVRGALAGLSKSRPQIPSSTRIAIKTVRVSGSAFRGRENASYAEQDDMDYEDDDSGFNTINDLERFVESPSPGQQLNTELEHVPTASQFALPPPNRKAASPGQIVLNKNSLQLSTTVSTATPPKGTAALSKAVSRAPQVMSKPGSAVRSSFAASKSNGKRPIHKELPPRRPSKRTKAISSRDTLAGTSAAHAMPVVVAQPMKHAKARGLMDPAASTNQIPITTAAAESLAICMKDSKAAVTKLGYVHPAKTSKERLSESMTGARPRSISVQLQLAAKLSGSAIDDPAPISRTTSPGKSAQLQRPSHAHRRQSRYPSRNSQTVDINGSPVPNDMEVTEISTVLETFSKQTDEAQGAVRQSVRFKTPMDGMNAAEEDACPLPPFHQPPLNLSSNTKALPGPSGSSSKTIRHVKLSNFETDVFMDKRMRTVLPSDPFVSPGEFPGKVRGRTSHAKQKQHLLERTIDFAQEIGLSATVGRDDVESSMSSSRNMPSPFQAIEKLSTKRAEPHVAPAHRSKFASDLDRQVAAFREHTAVIRAPDQDPDRTLVNDFSQETTFSKGSPSISSSASSTSATPELREEQDLSSQSDDDEDDLHTWRKRLKPHQLGLYEELVKIARVVTGYVTRQESSAEIMIDDSYRRELIMVKREEEVRKKQYKQYMVNLQQKRQEKVRELLNLDKVLQGVLHASAVGWEEHCEGRAEKERANRKIDELIGSWS